MRDYKYHNSAGFAPFGQILEDFFNKSIGDIVGGDISLNTPSANTYETDKAYVLEVAIPGISKNEIDIEIEKEYLIIASDNHKDKSPSYKRREFDFSKFRRRFKLKDDINVAEISATYDLGVLTIMLPKLDAKSANKSTKIKVS